MGRRCRWACQIERPEARTTTPTSTVFEYSNRAGRQAAYVTASRFACIARSIHEGSPGPKVVRRDIWVTNAYQAPSEFLNTAGSKNAPNTARATPPHFATFARF